MGENHQESKTELKPHKKSTPPIHWCIAAGLSATRLNTRPTVITANELGLKNNHTHTHRGEDLYKKGKQSQYKTHLFS